jgi:hypothetical protein
MSTSFWLLAPGIPDAPPIKEFERVKSFFTPYAPEDHAEFDCVGLVWPPGADETPSPSTGGWHLSPDLSATVFGWNTNDGVLSFDRPTGDLLWDTIFEASKSTGWLMFSPGPGDFFAINSAQADQWLRLANDGTIPREEIIMVDSAEALRSRVTHVMAEERAWLARVLLSDG